MLDVSVMSANKQHTSRVIINNYSKLTPKSARACLMIAGYHTGTVSQSVVSPDGEYTYYVAYRVYPRSVRKIWDVR